MIRLISLIDDRSLLRHNEASITEMAEGKRSANLVRMFESPTVDTVVGSIQGTLGKPGDVTFYKATRSDSVERGVPMQGFTGSLLGAGE